MNMESILHTRQRIDAMVGNLDNIAMLPEITARVTETVNDPRSTPADLHRIIAHDPALVSRLLKVVNSSYYALPAPIDSVERAIVLLGFQSVRNLAIAATIGHLFQKTRLCEGFTARDLWTHSVAVAVVSREIARLTCKPIAEELFLAGLLHDVGLLVSLQVCPEKLKTVCERAKREVTSFSMIELDVIGVEHQELGAAVAEKWGFPPSCRMAAAHHHYPSMADTAWQKIVAIVHVADTICCEAGIGFNLTAIHEIPDDAAFKGLVPLAAIDSARSRVHEFVDPALALFQ